MFSALLSKDYKGVVMVQDLTPEQYGRRILKVCRNYYFRAGEQLLPLMLYVALLFSNELQPEDVSDGLR